MTFTKLSDERHALSVVRADQSVDHIELDSRSFLRHDLAHFAVEVELEIRHGFWGSVAAGAALDGTALDGDQLSLAEEIAGPMQTMMRLNADPDMIRSVLDRVAPELSSDEAARRIHERLRHLRGRWRATPYRGEMTLSWPDQR